MRVFLMTHRAIERAVLGNDITREFCTTEGNTLVQHQVDLAFGIWPSRGFERFK